MKKFAICLFFAVLQACLLSILTNLNVFNYQDPFIASIKLSTCY